MLNHKGLEASCTGPSPSLPSREERLGGRSSYGRHSRVGSCNEIRTGAFLFLNPKPLVAMGLRKAESENWPAVSSSLPHRNGVPAKGPHFSFNCF